MQEPGVGLPVTENCEISLVMHVCTGIRKGVPGLTSTSSEESLMVSAADRSLWRGTKWTDLEKRSTTVRTTV